MPPFQSTSSEEDVVSRTTDRESISIDVSIHVLRRGRCVTYSSGRTAVPMMFQSTSSEEDVVSLFSGFVKDFHRLFQSTSSEEDVVSLRQFAQLLHR